MDRFLGSKRSAYTRVNTVHGKFVNPKGGEGFDYANDLKMEHLVGDKEVSLRGLCGNKTLKTVQRFLLLHMVLKNVAPNIAMSMTYTQSQPSTLMLVPPKMSRQC